MSDAATVLIVEDSFLDSYDLECRLQELGYRVEIAGTLRGARRSFRRLIGDLAAIVCDNRLVGGSAIASRLYRAVRMEARAIPFIVYSGFPPGDLPKDDPFLRIVVKPFSDDVIAHLHQLAPAPAMRPPVHPSGHTREAA